MSKVNGKLNSRQRKAIAALLSSRNVQEAAQTANIGERTLYRWLAENTVFRAALYAAEGEAIDAATRRLLSLKDTAIDTLAEVIAAPEKSPTGRLRAAQGVLDYLLKMRELRNLENRITELEKLVYL